MWNVIGESVAHDWISFDPVDVLYDFDFPRIFTCKDVPGNLYLAYNCDMDDHGLRFVVVPCSDDDIHAIVNGEINLRDSLSKYRCWVFDLDNSWEPTRAWRVDVDSLPFNALPAPGTMLRPDFPRIISQFSTRTCSSTTELTSSKW